MAVPTFIGAGTILVITTASGTGTASKAGCTVGNLIAVHMINGGTQSVGSKPASTDNTCRDLSGTLNNTTAVTGFNAGSQCGNPDAARQHLTLGRAAATTVNIFCAAASSDDLYVVLYEFSGVNAGTLLSDVIENATAGSFVNGFGTNITVTDTAVQTLGADRLACNFIAVNDDNALASFTGESGGDWTLATSTSSTTGTDAALGLETASIASATTIDGGSFAMAASDPWGVLGLALIPPAAAGANPYPYVGGGYYPAEG